MSLKMMVSFLLRSSVLATIPIAAVAQACSPWKCGPVQPWVEMSVEAVNPAAALVEHDPIDVTVRATLKGIATTALRSGRLCIREQTPDCVDVDLQKDSTVRRTIRTQAPAAGVAVPIEAFYCEVESDSNGECVEKFSSGSGQRVAIGARYEVILQSFEILHTRARQSDSVKVSLAGVAGATAATDSQLCDIVGPPTYCVGPIVQGDFNGGEVVTRGDIRVGPFTLIPESGPDLNLLTVITNSGHSYNEKAFLAFMNLMNTFGAGIYGSLEQSGGSELESATKTLNDAMVADCDGVVLSQMQILLNRTVEGQYASTLDARTRDNGFWVLQTKIDERANNVNCGDSSKYRATLRVVRTSWRAPNDNFDGQERIVLSDFSEENAPRYCPHGSAVVEVGCSGRYCDNLHLVCGRHAREFVFGHRDIDSHQWSGWYSEEDGGHPPGWLDPAPVTGFVTGVDCRGDYCDDLRVDSDAAKTPMGAGSLVGVVSEETAPARCPAGQFVTKLLCSGSYCDNISVWCSQ